MFTVFAIAVALQNSPDLDKIATAGRASQAQMSKRQTIWTATHKLENGASVEVHIVRQGDRQSVALRVAQQDFGRLIVRDGIWYASDALGPRKHRPYEAPFFIPTWYLYLHRAEPQFVTDPALVKGLTFEGVNGEVGTWRESLPESLRRQLKATMDQLRAAKVERPELFQKTQEFIDKGFLFRVHLTSGLIQEFENAKLSTRISDYWTPTHPDPRIFDIPEKEWQDYTDDPLKGNRADLLMLAHTPVWQKGQKAGDMTLGLVDSATGRFRRIPFEGSIALSGCFSKDRGKVYITGLGMDGALWPYEVDLANGRNRKLATNLPVVGNMMFACLAPDGRSLALLHTGGDRRLLESDVVLVNLESGDARYIGRPADRAFLSWDSDGQSLILLERLGGPLEGPQTHWICRMDLEGKVTRIREGDCPVLLQDGTTILFEDRKAGGWFTCDLKGKNEKPLGNGRRNYGFAAPAPDGKQLLMMRFRSDGGPEPVIIDLTTDQERVLPHGPGLWAQPAWR